MRGRFLLISFLVALVACRPDTIPLTYTLSAGSVLTYRLAVHAEAEWDIAGEGRGHYDVVFDVNETVLSSDAQGSLVRVAMTPTSVTEEGLPSPGPVTRSFTMRIGTEGEVLEVVEVEGLPAEAVEADDLSFIGTYRPPLPDAPVRLGDGWRAEQELQVGQLFQHIETQGRLNALRLGPDGTRLARLSYEGEGPLVWATTLSRGEAELKGSARITTTATFAIDDGYLERARSLTEGSFDVQVVQGAAAPPIRGTLALAVDVDLTRVDEIGTPIPDISP